MNPQHQILKPLVDACEAVVPVSLWFQHPAVVAVSGGCDSVALLRTLVQIARANQAFDGSKIIVGHVDHALRGADSTADKDFVKRLADEFNVVFAEKRLDLTELLEGRENASEELLRDARYGCLKKIAEENNARYLFTGHHRGDQAETILFRIFRGTGLAGLKGIPSIRSDDWLTIVRPLLKVSKEEILKALAALDQAYCSDATNETNDYSRNFIRNEILTKTRDYFGSHVDEAIARLADHAKSALELEAKSVEQLLSSLSPTRTEETVSFEPRKLREQPAVLVRAVLIRLWQLQMWPQDQMTFDRWDFLADRICNASAETYVENLPGDLRFEANAKRVKISSSCQTKK